MDKQKEKKIDRFRLIVTIAMILCFIAYLLYIVLVKKEVSGAYPYVIAAFLVILWIVNDVAPILLAGGFRDKTEEQKKAYYISSLLDLVGYAGLGYFALAYSQNTGIYGALVYAGTVMFRRKYWEEYVGKRKDGEGDS